MKRAAVRLADVAAQAQVSLATASRVLNSQGGYTGRPALRERVLAAAAELGYEPNFHAQALASATSTTIGLVLHDIRDAYFALMAGAIVRTAEAHGLFVTIVCTYRDPSQELKYVKLLRAQRPRAIIMAGSGFINRSAFEPIETELTRFEETGGVVVSVVGDRGVGHRIVLENESGSRELAHTLADLGHTRFAVATGPARLTTARDRLKGFRLGLQDRGLELPKGSVHHVDMTREGGLRLAELIAAQPERPTCVFAAFDVVAAGLIAGLQQNGVDVPGEVSVAGFGDIPLAAQITPALSTVSVPLELIGQQAVELAMVEDSSIRRSISIDGTVVMRASTAPVPARVAAHDG
ncbi:LacI family DNA-binding transcriptional regulator [Georgenia subflava]|uniref:LacI family DNA-binding transcriptional regulator n=1 Tax=Georgenia subflava TaxID=1622177 RepID=UPI00186B56B0|nr:LacI family DNA-binding transcriptional regulator [Georgenia subflava]